MTYYIEYARTDVFRHDFTYEIREKRTGWQPCNCEIHIDVPKMSAEDTNVVKTWIKVKSSEDWQKVKDVLILRAEAVAASRAAHVSKVIKYAQVGQEFAKKRLARIFQEMQQDEDETEDEDEAEDEDETEDEDEAEDEDEILRYHVMYNAWCGGERRE